MKVKDKISLSYDEVSGVIESHLKEANALIKLLIESSSVEESISEPLFNQYRDAFDDISNLMEMIKENQKNDE